MTIGETVKDLYKRGYRLRVTFTKLNGQERTMLIQRDEKMEARCVGKPVYQYEDRLPVIEIENKAMCGLPQWRCIPLERVKSYTVHAS